MSKHLLQKGKQLFEKVRRVLAEGKSLFAIVKTLSAKGETSLLMGGEASAEGRRGFGGPRDFVAARLRGRGFIPIPFPRAERGAALSSAPSRATHGLPAVTSRHISPLDKFGVKPSSFAIRAM